MAEKPKKDTGDQQGLAPGTTYPTPTPTNTPNPGGPTLPGPSTNPTTGPSTGGQTTEPIPLGPSGATPPVVNKPVEVVELLRMYCQACHAVGIAGLKFILSDVDKDVIKYILTADAPSKVNWAKSIVQSLSWPNNQPSTDPNEKKLMPIGAKKFQIMGNNHNMSDNDRQLLIKKLNEVIANPPP